MPWPKLWLPRRNWRELGFSLRVVVHSRNCSVEGNFHANHNLDTGLVGTVPQSGSRQLKIARQAPPQVTTCREAMVRLRATPLLPWWTKAQSYRAKRRANRTAENQIREKQRIRWRRWREQHMM